MIREIWWEIIEKCKTDLSEDEIISFFESNYTISKKGESIEVRQSKFANQLAEFKNEYAREMLKDFYLYWCESSTNGRKMRFEKEKVFDIKLRLQRWHKNSKHGIKKTGHDITEISNRADEILREFASKNGY